MRAQRTGVAGWTPAVAAVGAAVFLLAPWAGSGRVDRSTLDLLTTASALDVWEGPGEILAVGTWYLVPVLGAAALVAAGWHRPGFSAACALPIGPLMALAWLAVVRSPFEARWGAVAGTVSGLAASASAGLLLLERRSRRKVPT